MYYISTFTFQTFVHVLSISLAGIEINAEQNAMNKLMKIEDIEILCRGSS